MNQINLEELKKIIEIKTQTKQEGFESFEKIIYSTWLKGLYYGNDWFKEMPSKIYFKHYHKVIERILNRPHVVIRFAYLKEDQDIIVSYAVLEKAFGSNILHWVFTKSAWRKFGIAKLLLSEKIDYYTSLTKIGKNIKPIEWEFNPFLI